MLLQGRGFDPRQDYILFLSNEIYSKIKANLNRSNYHYCVVENANFKLKQRSIRNLCKGIH